MYLTDQEKAFLLNLFSNINVRAVDSNAAQVIFLVNSITEKLGQTAIEKIQELPSEG